MNNYEINEDTLAIFPKNDNESIIYENDESYNVPLKTMKIMENSCEYFGSTYEGRKKGTTSLIGLTHKVPIIIEETNNIIFFPTASIREKKCKWISLNNIVKCERYGKKCKIYFKNGKYLVIDVSYGIINNQILRASRLQLMLNQRKNIINNKKNTKKTKK